MWEYNYNYSDDELMHYGVVGMRWGKRKAKASYKVKKSKINSNYHQKGDNLRLSVAKYALTTEQAKMTDRQAKAQYKRDVKTMGKDAAKAKYKKTYAGLEKDIRSSADEYRKALTDYSGRAKARKKELKKAKKEYRADKKAYRAEAKAAVSKAKTQYKAAKKKADQRYLNSKEGEDIAGDKWVAEKKAAKQQYKAVKKKYR